MSRNKKILIGVGHRRPPRRGRFRQRQVQAGQDGVAVNVEAIQKRDLEAIVSASGKIQPKRLVNISADTMGRVTDSPSNEGDRVKKGQFLLQIDPRNLRDARRQRTRRRSQAARVAGSSSCRLALESAQVALEAGAGQLQPPAGAVEGRPDDARDARAGRERASKCAQANLQRAGAERPRRSSCASRRSAPTLESASYDLSKVRIESPIDGIVTRRNIEEGETVVIGTMNNAGTVLLTIADMSVIEAEVEVDETDIPNVQLGQPAKVTIDAMPDKTFNGNVTEIGNSPIQAAGQAAPRAGDQLQGRR